MSTYLHPGVYLEEIPSGVRPIEGASTSTAAILGYATKGTIGEPELIFNWDTYNKQYGGIRDTTNGTVDAMGYSVFAFFQNGGRKAYIVRLVSGNPQTARAFIEHPDDATQLIRFDAVNEGTWGETIRVNFAEQAGNPGRYEIIVSVVDRNDEAQEQEKFSDLSLIEGDPDFIDTRLEASDWICAEMQDVTAYQLGISRSGDLTAAGVNLTNLNNQSMDIVVDQEAVVNVPFVGLTPASTFADVATIIEDTVTTGAGVAARMNFTARIDGDRLVLTSGTRTPTSRVVVTGPAADNAAATLLLGPANGGVEQTGQESLQALFTAVAGTVPLTNGDDGNEPDSATYTAAFTRFRKIRDASIFLLPGQVYSNGDAAIIDAAIAHAGEMTNRMVIVDPPSGTELISPSNVSALGLPTSTYSVLYYPYVKVRNPHYDEEKRPDRDKTVLVPPSAFAAGIWSKTDGKRGVWKAPAGVETALLGADGLEFTVGDDEQDQLNPLGINCIRQLNVAGLAARVVWGSRTLATKADPEWRYVPVRRTAIFIEESIYNAIHWAVFEPNDHRLWSSLRVNIDSFMNGLFRAGAFQGEKASDAYFVRCGLGDTMTQGDIDRGQVIVIVGFAPLKPAEFVIVRIQQKVQQQ
jgi:phage tail sheath protein FI